MFWRQVVASTVESDSTARGFVKEQGEALAKGFSFSGYERDLVALNRGDGTYLAISGVSGLDSVTDGRAAVFADFDNDGDTDVFLETMHGPTHLLFRNELGQEAHSCRVELRGTKGEAAAHGAVVRLKTSAGIVTKVKAGGSFLAQGDPRLLFGMGEDDKASWLRVTWPGGEEQEFAGPRAGESLLLVQGEPLAQRIEERRFQLPDATPKSAAEWVGLQIASGDLVPTEGLLTVEGEPFSPDWGKGEPTVVNLWATWCVSCRREMPELQRAHSEEGWRVLGISVDAPETRDAIPSYLKSLDVSYPVAVASRDWLKEIFETDRLQVPLTLLVEGDGRVRVLVSGWSRRKRLKLQAALDTVSASGVTHAGR